MKLISLENKSGWSEVSFRREQGFWESLLERHSTRGVSDGRELWREKALQVLLELHPEIIPWDELDRTSNGDQNRMNGHVICREISDGPSTDILMLYTPKDGDPRLVVVETKLSANSEIRGPVKTQVEGYVESLKAKEDLGKALKDAAEMYWGDEVLDRIGGDWGTLQRAALAVDSIIPLIATDIIPQALADELGETGICAVEIAVMAKDPADTKKVMVSASVLWSRSPSWDLEEVQAAINEEPAFQRFMEEATARAQLEAGRSAYPSFGISRGGKSGLRAVLINRGKTLQFVLRCNEFAERGSSTSVDQLVTQTLAIIGDPEAKGVEVTNTAQRVHVFVSGEANPDEAAALGQRVERAISALLGEAP